MSCRGLASAGSVGETGRRAEVVTRVTAWGAGLGQNGKAGARVFRRAGGAVL